ncbi:TonB-dependent receptor [Pedobacter kyungheensis]|uniref:TonB-dependent receptor n=1 Tax=Pedobacter kyungheensis TaxID=1069985 RepID=UPI0006897725|nr:TonB-dependent receptor [Pedobacter kyungheensis]
MKIYDFNLYSAGRIKHKILLSMKLTVILLFVAFLHVNASSFAQKNITLNEKNASLQKVLKSIKSQSGFNVFFIQSDLKKSKAVNIDVKDVTLAEALNQCFKDQPLTYSIQANTIVVKERPATVVPATKTGQEAPVYKVIDVIGTILDEIGKGIPGASIKVKGKEQGTISDEAGNFKLTGIADDAILIVSYLGYQTKEVKAAATLKVTLVPQTNDLNDVVVVAYGTQKKVNLSGAVNTVNTKTLVNRPVTSLTNALQGAVPGVAIKSAPGDLGSDMGTINVRGRANLGTSSPLFVVDGVVVSQGDFARINPNDVAGISVLKDASASSIYGARAANGVILVTTKKGNGTPTISYNAYYGRQSATYLPDFADANNYALLRNEAETNMGRSPLYDATALAAIRNQSNPDLYPNTNWYDLILRKSAPMMEHQVSIAGGDKTKYYLSGTYFGQNSLIPGKNLNRYSLRANTETQISDKFKIGSNLSFIRDGYNNDNLEIGFTGVGRSIPLSVAKQSNGQWGSVTAGKENATIAGQNPLRLLEEGGRTNNNTNRFIGNLNGTYTPVKGLDISGLFSYNTFNYFNSSFINTIDPVIGFISQKPLTSTAVLTNQLTERWQSASNLLSQATASYEKNIDKHYFKVLAGASYEKAQNRTLIVVRKGFPNNDLNAVEGGSALPENTTVTNDGANGGVGESALASVFARVNYAFADKYLFEASARNDASSRFAPGHRAAWYPSASVAWRISQEDFMKNLTAVNELKIRLSAGKLGNINNVGNYDFYDGLNVGSTVILDESKQDGVSPGKLANPLLSWEKLTTYNAGLDATLFKSLTLQLDVFSRITKDILLPNPNIPTEAGLGSGESPSVNLGAVKNNGLELSLNYNGKINDFGYSIGGNLSKIWNKVTDLGGANETAPSGYYINRIGQPVGSFYMWQAEGLFVNQADVNAHAKQANNPKPGDIKYKDQNGDGVIDGNDRVINGNDVPYFTYGLNLSANYKGFDFSVLAQGVGNVKTYLEMEASQAFFNGAGVKNYVLDRWTVNNPDPNAAYPRVTSDTQNFGLSSFWLFDASYFRVKAITLGYTIPQNILDKAKIKGLRIYASSNNPFTIRGDKRLKDFDPEVPSQRSAYPVLKTFSVGLNLTL